MSLPTYDAYKETGIDWLGRVPSHWAAPKLRHLARFSGGGTPSRDIPSYWNGDIPWVSPKDMKTECIESTEERITAAGMDNSTSSLVEAGRVLLVVRSGILKHTIPVAINSVPVTLNQDMKALAFDARICAPTFFMRWVQGLNDSLLLAWAKQGATVESIEHSYLADTVVPLPPFAEQTAIVAFLDRETAKIDALIIEQKKLIALLAEKRQVTISHAVTKGLNPNAPMKDSGVAWLGEVPVHWDVVTFQRCVYVQEGQVNPEEEPYRSMLLIAPNHVESGTGRLLYIETAHEQSAESGKYLCNAGDVIYSKIRPALRKVCIAPENCLCSADMYPLRGTSKLLNVFLKWFILSEPFSALAELESQRVAMPKINRESLKAVWLSVPSLEEQEAIDAFLNTETAKLDSLMDAASTAIRLLTERRSALVAAAVTGQIDVRCALPQAIVDSSEAIAA